MCLCCLPRQNARSRARLPIVALSCSCQQHVLRFHVPVRNAQRMTVRQSCENANVDTILQFTIDVAPLRSTIGATIDSIRKGAESYGQQCELNSVPCKRSSVLEYATSRQLCCQREHRRRTTTKHQTVLSNTLSPVCLETTTHHEPPAASIL